MTYLYSNLDPAASSNSTTHRSCGSHDIGTLAIDRKLHPNGIAEPPTHSICRECTR